MSWIGADLETLTTIFIDKIGEGIKDLTKITEFSGSHEQRISYGDFKPRTYQITSGALNATESAAFITFFSNHGNLTPFKFVYETATIYTRFDGGFVMDGTVANGIKRSVRFALKEVNSAEIIL